MINNVNKQYLRNLLKHAAHTTTFDIAITKFREDRTVALTKMLMEQGEKNFHKVQELTRIIETKDLIDKDIYDSLSRGNKILAGLVLSLLVCAGYFPLEPHFPPKAKYRSGYRIMKKGWMGMAA